jgi:hypothetical protein
MTNDNIPKELSASQTNLNSRIFDLVIGRVLKKAYLSFDESGKKNIEKVFLSDNNEEKEKFIKEHIPNFAELFNEATKEIEEEMKLEIEKQV